MTSSKTKYFYLTILLMLIWIPLISVTPSAALTVAPTALEIYVDQSKTATVSDFANGVISYVRSHGDDDDSTTLDIGSPGTNRLVVVIAGDENTGNNLSAVTVDGKSCTLVTRADNTDGNHLEMWYIDEDGLGSSDGTVTVAISGGDSGWAVHAHLYTGVDQSGPTDSWIDNQSTGISTVTVTDIDIPANGLVVMGAGQGRDNKTATWTSPLVERIDGSEWDPQSAGLADASAVVSTQQTDKTYVCTWSTSDFGRGTGIAAVWPAAGGGSGPYSVSSSNESVATATLSDNTVTVVGQGVTGGGPDSVVITITDSESNSVAISVTVRAKLAATPGYLFLDPTDSQTFTISGGMAPYSVSSGNTTVATVTEANGTVTVTAVAGGTVGINVTDDDGNIATVQVEVSGGAGVSELGQCPQPPFVIEANVEPNILVIMDSSGSMKKAVDGFFPDEAGELRRWDIARNVLYDILNEVSGVRFGLMRLDGTGSTDVDEGDKHWYSGDPVKRQRGKVLAPCGTPNDDIRDYLLGWDVPDRPWETTSNHAEALASGGQYFATVIEGGNRTGKEELDNLGYYVKNYHYEYGDPASTYDATTTDDNGNTIDTTSPIQFYCRKSFVIFITDGEAGNDDDWSVVAAMGDPDNDGSFDDVAKYLYEHDMRSDLAETQNITTYVIGFLTDDEDDETDDHVNDYLKKTAAAGGGQFYTADNADDLRAALEGAVRDIFSKVSSGTAVSTLSTSTETDDYVIKAKFIPVLWRGQLSAFTLPYTDEATPYWDAGAQLADRLYTDRHIYTYMSSKTPQKQEFVSTLNTDFSAQWGVTDSEAADIIDYIRGSSANEGGTYRDRDGWKLGDIIYSEPVTVGPPKLYYTESDYPGFKAAHQDRTTMVYVGANDGMLHAFRALDDPAADCDGDDAGSDQCGGSEQWAFIPEFVHDKLDGLTDKNCHNYYVDLTPVVRDIYEDGTWKTVLIGGNRLGGDEYFCLDVTKPTHNKFKILWDTRPFPGFKSSTIPVVGKVQYDDGTGTVVEKWVAVITSGFHESTDAGKIAALNFTDGTKEAIWDSTDPYLDTQPKSVDNAYYTLSSPVAVDSDDDGYLDLVYAGDTEGTLWKFYYDYEDKDWKGVELFNTGGQPITAKPVVAFDDTGKLRIYFGTGKFLINRDKSDTTRSALYCLIEDKVDTADANDGHYTGTTPISKADDLVDLTAITTQANYGDLNADDRTKVLDNGWYFQLDAPTGFAERIFEEAVVLAGVVFFTSYTPDADACGHGGSARLYAVDYRTSLQAIGKNGATVLDNVTADVRSKELGSGIPSKPVYYFDINTKQTQMIIQTSDTTVHPEPANVAGRPLGIFSWSFGE